jgi:hypothetical protein
MNADNLEIILNTEITQAQRDAARKFLESFPHTTTALFALQLALDEIQDSDSASGSLTALKAATLAVAEAESSEL